MSGRIRTIKPELLEDERTAGLSHEAFRLFIGMITLADDYGRGRGHGKLLDGAVFWAKPAGRDIEDVLQELVDAGLVLLFEVRGQRYFHLTGWSKHQRVDKPGKPRCPSPDDPEARTLAGTSRISREALANASRENPGPGSGSTSIPSATAQGSVPVEETATAVAVANDSRVSRETLAPDHDHDPDQDPDLDQEKDPGPAASPPADSGESATASSAEVRQVFEYWATRRAAITGAPVSTLKLRDDRRRKIQARLREGYTVEQLQKAIDGMLGNPFNIEGHHTDVELACRDAAHVDRYMLGPPAVAKAVPRNAISQQNGFAVLEEDGTP